MPGFYFSLSVPTVGPIFLHIEECHSLYNLGEASNMYALMYWFLPSRVVHLYRPLVLFSVSSSWMILCHCLFPLWQGRTRQILVSLQGTEQLEVVVSVLRLRGTPLSHSKLRPPLNLGGVDKRCEGMGNCSCLKPEVGGGILAYNMQRRSPLQPESPG